MANTKTTMDDLAIAIAWLESNEGEMNIAQDGEQDSCKRVAEFLRAEFRRRDHAGNVRAAKRFGTTPEHVAEVIAKSRAKDGIKLP